MWVRLRAIFVILLVCLIVLIVVSPYVDLPLTNLRARQALLSILTVLACCGAAAASWRDLRRAACLWTEQLDLRGLHDLPGRTCTLLC